MKKVKKWPDENCTVFTRNGKQQQQQGANLANTLLRGKMKGQVRIVRYLQAFVQSPRSKNYNNNIYLEYIIFNNNNNIGGDKALAGTTPPRAPRGVFFYNLF